MIPDSPNESRETSKSFGSDEEENDDDVECQYCCQTKTNGCQCDEESEEGEEDTDKEPDDDSEEEEDEEYQKDDSYFDPGVRRYVYREK